MSAFHTWYPIAFSNHIKTNQIHSLTLLNEPILLYRDHHGQVSCLQDRCPHRSTPLSLGRIVEGNIECRYHGWQFNSKGHCARIPAQDRSISMPPHACVPTKNVIEKDGIIWLNHQAQQDNTIDPRHTAVFDTVNDKTSSFDYSIDLDIPHELMIENLLDPAHLPFAHHGTISKRDKACPIAFQVEKTNSGLTGNAILQDTASERHTQFHFIAPHTVYFDTSFGNKGMRQLHYCLPLCQNRMRLNSRFFYHNMPWLKWIPFAEKLHSRMSRKIVFQDIAMLDGQNRRLMQGAKAWNQAIPADKMAMQYRQWLNAELKKKQPWFNHFNENR